MTNKTQGKIKTDTKTLREIVREEVRRALQNLTGDPDAGLELRDEVKEQLKQVKDISDEDLIPFSEVKEKHS
jgi:hypothetical protein